MILKKWCVGISAFVKIFHVNSALPENLFRTNSVWKFGDYFLSLRRILKWVHNIKSIHKSWEAFTMKTKSIFRLVLEIISVVVSYLLGNGQLL